MATQQNSTELQNVILWFLDLPYVEADDKLELMDYIAETNEISIEVLVFIQAVLEQNNHMEQQKLSDLQHTKDLLQSLTDAEKNEETSARVSVVKEAEAFLKKTSGDFKEDWGTFVHIKNKEAETAEHSEDEALAQSLRDQLTK